MARVSQVESQGRFSDITHGEADEDLLWMKSTADTSTWSAPQPAWPLRAQAACLLLNAWPPILLSNLPICHSVNRERR